MFTLDLNCTRFVRSTAFRRKFSDFRLKAVLRTFLIVFVVLSSGCEQPTTKIQPVDLTERNKPVVLPKLQADADKPSVSVSNDVADNSPANQDEEPYAFGQDFLDFDKYSVDGLMEVVRSGDFKKSETLIKRFLTKHPHDVKIHRARQQLASDYSRARQDEAAMKINRELLEYFFAHADGNRELCEMFPTTVVFVNSKLQAAKKDDERKKLIADALKVLRKNQSEFIDAEPLSTGINLLSGIQIRELVGLDKKQQASELAEREIARLKIVADRDPKNDTAQAAYAATIKNAFLNLPFETEKNALRMKDYDKIITAGVDRDRSSKLFAKHYFGIVQRRMGLFLRGDPVEAKAYYDQAFDRLSDLATKQPGNKSLARSLRSMRTFEKRVNKSLQLAKLKGSPAMAIAGTHWINGDKFTLAEKKDKQCVLLMFTRADSRTCEKCLPQIQIMSLKNQNTLQVVGVSQFLGLAWDNTRGRAVRKQDVSQEQELDAIKNFAKANRVEFPIAVVSEDVIQQYAATSMPQFVLIDRAGNIRHLTVGLDPQGLAELEAAVAKAVAE